MLMILNKLYNGDSVHRNAIFTLFLHNSEAQDTLGGGEGDLHGSEAPIPGAALGVPVFKKCDIIHNTAHGMTDKGSYV